MKIKFQDLKEINKPYTDELKIIVNKIIDSGWYISGNEKKTFESNFSSYLNSKYILGVGNGLDALKLIFSSYVELGVLKPGDEIIVPANTFIASILAIVQSGLKPVLVEPSSESYNLDLNLLESKISKKTKGILIVHLYGLVCWSSKLLDIKEKYKILLIEDNAQAIGAKYGNRFSGTLGDAAAFSFYPGKNLGAMGDAGAIATDNLELYSTVKSLSNYGSIQKYIHNNKGYNSRMDEIQAGILNFKLNYLEKENIIRRNYAKYYINNIVNIHIKLPVDSNFFNDEFLSNSHVWHLFVIRVKNRIKFIEYLNSFGIEVLIHYPIPPHKQKAFVEYINYQFPITEELHNQVVSLPLNPSLTFNDLDYIIKIVNNYND